jgi:hypothetical protein
MFILDTSFWPWIQIRVLPIGGVRSSDRRRRRRSNWTASLSSGLMAGDAAGRFASGGIGKRIRPGERPLFCRLLDQTLTSSLPFLGRSPFTGNRAECNIIQSESGLVALVG